MRKPGPGWSAIVFCSLLCALFADQVIAQSDKISIRFVPIPNQTVRFTITSEGEMEISYPVNAPGSEIKPMKMTIKSVLGLSQKTGQFDQQGRIDADLTYEIGESQILMEGTAFPVDEIGKRLIGKKIKAIYDRKGELLDLKVPDDLGISSEIIKKTLQSFYSSMPQEPIGIGETATSPASLDFSIPGFGEGPLKIQGETRTKLTAIEKEANGRFAKFGIITDMQIAKMTEMELPTGKLTMNLEGKISGSGTARVNLDRGVPMQSETIMNIDAKTTMPTQTGDLQMPSMSLKGAMKVTILATN